MNQKYIEKLGRIICNTYGIAKHDPAKVGKLIHTTFRLLEEEMMRDLREEANKAQWGDEAAERRMDIIGSNSNEGLHYEAMD